MAKSPSTSMELEDRDPQLLSQHLKDLSWEDVIGEPREFRSPECAWNISNTCFNASKNCCYTFLTVIMAPIAALCLGCSLACLAFEQIWCWTPSLRMMRVIFSVVKSFVMMCSQACIIPCSEAFGHYWSRLKVRTQVVQEEKDDYKNLLIV